MRSSYQEKPPTRTRNFRHSLPTGPLFLLRSRAASARITGFLYDLMIDAHATPGNHPAIERALDFIGSHVSQAFTLDELDLDKSYFIRLFKKNISVPPMKYAMNLKMSAASDLLRTSSDPLAAVAARVGFDDEYHFAKRFKQWSGTAPGAFRKQGCPCSTIGSDRLNFRAGDGIGCEPSWAETSLCYLPGAQHPFAHISGSAPQSLSVSQGFWSGGQAGGGAGSQSNCVLEMSLQSRPVPPPLTLPDLVPTPSKV